MKKLLSLILILTLALSLALPAAADEADDEALARVTQAVKETLDLDTDDYDEFRGNRYEDGLTGTWSLAWTGTDQELSVQALDDGTVTSYRLSWFYTASEGGDFPAFPRGDADQAARSARTFLDRVLGPGESVELGEPRGMDTLGSDSFRFSGEILLNGLPSPLNWSVTVRAEDNVVTYFNRDAGAEMFLGDVPGSYAAVPAARAAETLAGTLALRLEYVRAEDSTAAVLRYLPNPIDTCYVDAVTGRLLNLTELEGQMDGLAGGSAGDTTASEGSADNGLTQAEQEGIAKLEGVLPTETLDQRLRAQAAYGLEDYGLSSARYLLREAPAEDGADQVVCLLDYVRFPAEGSGSSRTVVVDARTGAVESVSSYAPRLAEGETPALTEAEAQAEAEAFLADFCGGRWESLALYESNNDPESRRPYYAFTYAQEANGIPFPENFYTVAIDSADGSVYRLDFQYDGDVTFASPEGIVDLDTALDAWAGTYETVLAYRLVPRPLDAGDPAEARLMELGLTDFYELRLTYALEREGSCQGIDAAGEPLWREETDGALTYSDLAGAAERADIEKLAAFGVGYDGGVFQPDRTLTQWDLAALLASLEGWRVDPAEADERTVDSVYSAVYRMGALTPEERDETAPVTRAALIRCLLNCAGYGPAARLEGIFTCDYADRADIPAGELGYAALAQALGMTGERYDGGAAADRGTLASMLCRLLER